MKGNKMTDNNFKTPSQAKPIRDYIDISRETPQCDFRDMPRVDFRISAPLYPHIADEHREAREKYKGVIR